MDRARPGEHIRLPNTGPDATIVVGEDAGFEADRVAGETLKREGQR
jgi:hypothetical protein